jgi:DNA-binding NarL/FixJ family response regulator
MDCELFRYALKHPRARCRIAGTTSNANEARSMLKRLHPNVAVVSPHLQEGALAGFDLVQEMRQEFQDVPVIMLLDSLEPRMVLYSFERGAKGVFSRDRSLEDLAKCIEVVHRGQIWAGTNELEIILQAMAKRSHFKSLSQTGSERLTSREAEVAALVAEGLQNKEISDRMKLSAHTVKNYLYRVYEKLGISSRVELTARVLTQAKTQKLHCAENPSELTG